MVKKYAEQETSLKAGGKVCWFLAHLISQKTVVFIVSSFMRIKMAETSIAETFTLLGHQHIIHAC
jgi:hypothetical protein